jgi:Cupin superfamily protein
VKELARVLHPVSPEAFFRDHWDRRALHIPGPPEKLAGIYDATTWTRFEGVEDLKAVTTDPRGVQVEIPALPEQAGALFLRGFTICANVSAAPLVAPFLRAFRAELGLPGGPPFAKLYASNDGGGFAVHADKHHVFVLQVAGKKLWRFSREPAVAAPRDGLFMNASGAPSWSNGASGEGARHDDGRPVAAPDVDALGSALLEPGHCLYMPPGTWHVARAQGHSIAVSVSPERATVADFVLAALRERLDERAAWRRDLFATPGQASAAGGVPAALEAELGARLADLRDVLAGFDERRLHRLWSLGVAAGRAGDEAAAPGPPDAGEIRRSDVFARADREPFRVVVAPSPSGDGDRCFFYRRGGEWSLPASAREVLARIAEREEVRAEAALAWDRRLKFQDVRDILATLVAAGVLVRREGA